MDRDPTTRRVRLYIVHAGGNTRLRIYKALYQETGAERFRTVTCVYRPWTRRPMCCWLIQRENDLRGDLSFIDKALAVRDAKRLLQQGAGTGNHHADRAR